ncbi:MAG: large conductance mechanosensitive channel protein MscL [Acidimicrobiales bacterium]
MLKGFRDFITRGNVIDLAVAVVIGAAFTAVVAAIVNNLINPLIAAIFGQPDLSDVGVFTINDAVFSIGAVITAVINFLIVAAAIYFFVVVPVNAINERRRTKEVAPEEEVAPSDEALLLAEIRDLLRAESGRV